jgi:hypothetical protein
MVGPDALFAAVRAGFRAPLWELLGEHRYLLYFVTAPGAEGVLLPAGQGDRWMYGIIQGPNDDDRPSREEFRERIRRAVGIADFPVEIEDTGWFAAAAQVAERFRVGNVFLVGDAAHRVTPRGGTGLNTAIADGRDLGWKLVWVMRDWAPDSLLDSYEGERRGPVTHNVERSADPMGTRRGVDTEVAHDLGGRLPHVWVENADPASSDGRRSSLDLVGPGLTMFTADESGAWQRAAAALVGPSKAPPLEVVALPAVTAWTMGIGPAGAMLVRPDGVPVSRWWASADPAADLRTAVSTVLGASGEARVRRAA